MRKITFISQINMSATKAAVFIGARPFASIYRAGGAWHATSASGTPLLPRTPHTVEEIKRLNNGTTRRMTREITLGEIIKTLRERVEAKLNGSAA